MYFTRARITWMLGFCMLFSGCNQMPSEVRMSQLTSIRYYREEDKGDVLRKSYYYYKPYIYKYGSMPFTGKVKELSEREKLRSEGFMKDGFPDGHWTYYNSNGSIKATGIYKNGVKDSIWTSNYTDGSLKLVENYFFKNDTLWSDTINAWYYNGKKLVETSGDTVRRFYKNGRLMAKTIKGKERLHEAYLQDGTVYFRENAHTKEFFYTNGKLRCRTYYLRDKIGANLFANEKHHWSAEEKEALTKADSVFFDYSNYWDPVIKIYVGD